MSELDGVLAELGSEERLRGRGFERLCKWVLENEPGYAARLGQVWLWPDWPGNGGRIDAGIDLVAEDRDGGLWAIQAKHYDPAYSIKKADLDSFLSESSRREFRYRLLIASTDHLGSTARRTLEGQEKPVGTLLRSDLEALDLPWPRSLSDLRPARAKPKTPRPHQRRAVGEIMSGLKATDRGQVVMACGTGNTLVARFLHDQMSSRRTLVLVPSLSLLKQSLREWLSVGGFDFLAVCSDETVTPDEADAVVSMTTELGVPVTTEPAEITSFLRRRGSGVVFATYQSSPRIATAQEGRVPRFDLVVADEAHRCAGPEAGVFATVLDPNRIKARKRVFLTATPRYFTGRVKKAAQDADWEVASNGRRGEFGPSAPSALVRRRDRRGPFSDYQVVLVGVTDWTMRKWLSAALLSPSTARRSPTRARSAGRSGCSGRSANHRPSPGRQLPHAHREHHSRFAVLVVALAEWMPERASPRGFYGLSTSGKMTSGERETRLNRLRAVECRRTRPHPHQRPLPLRGGRRTDPRRGRFHDPRSSQVDECRPSAARSGTPRQDCRTPRSSFPSSSTRRRVSPRHSTRPSSAVSGRSSASFARPRRCPRRRTRPVPTRTRAARIIRREAHEGRPRSPSGVGVDFAHAFEVDSSERPPEVGSSGTG